MSIVGYLQYCDDLPQLVVRYFAGLYIVITTFYRIVQYIAICATKPMQIVDGRDDFHHTIGDRQASSTDRAGSSIAF
jgi:hypothetical protein